MIPVVYPRSLNWFYATQAHAMASDLSALGIPARAVPSDKPADIAACGSEAALLVCYAEALVAAERHGRRERFLDVLKPMRARILVNFDSIRSSWFTRHFDDPATTFSDVFDFGFYRQSTQPTVMGVPYRFVPESLSAAEEGEIAPWQPGRALPWAMLGHATRDRAALLEAVLQSLPKGGFVFSPPLRPFTERSALNRAALGRVLAQTDLYIWGSHHLYPYHETQRVLHAVSAGAIPCKIDPLHSHRLDLPWVYPSMEALIAARERHGLAGLYEAARRRVAANGRLGRNLRDALAAAGVVRGLAVPA